MVRNDVAKVRLGICLVLALLVGGATMVLPTPALATERAMRVDTVLAPTDGSVVSAAASGLVAKFAQVDVAPFDMVGASWEGREAGTARVRTRAGGSWSRWTELEVEDEDAPDPGSRENRNPRTVTRPLWAEKSDGFELEAPSAGLKVHLVRQDGARVRLVSAPDAGAADRPPIADRGSWGARPPREAPSYAPNVKMAFLHHTAGSNSYGADDVPTILRSDQAYHMDVRRWNDIGYNFLVDRFGRIWEGRAGGVDNAVIGAHAEGYNTGSTGVAVLGTFTSADVPSSTVDSVSRLLGWKLAKHGV
ncbi:MAG TPA: peptidoglycan recognition protein, partial [Acidimicrobiales bacterium]|nr:peptidoglycan recognition protein [Acidimicrobiales bacterium]